jgi:hypothetical protein
LTNAAIGFRAHSGWAAQVAVAGTPTEPAIVFRRRIELSKKTPRQPFHAAEHLEFAKAEKLIRRATDEAMALAARAIDEAAAELRADGHKLVAAGLLLAAGKPLPDLAHILGSHALIHSAEGELFRDVLRRASADAGLRVTEIRERDLDGHAASALRASEITSRLAQWGKVVGPPWTQDEKRAALVAWLALAT